MLVVDPSIVARALLVRLMKPYCDLAVDASGIEDAKRALRTHSDLSLIEERGYEVVAQILREAARQEK